MHIIFLLFKETNAAYRAKLNTMKAAAEERFQKTCFQMDGTRHVCLPLLKKAAGRFAKSFSLIQMSEKQAKNVKFIGEFSPIELKIKGLKDFPMSISLAFDTQSSEQLKKALQGLTILPKSCHLDFDVNELHLSLYRKRKYGKGVKARMTEVRNAVVNDGGEWGSITCDQICIKRIGADYDTARVIVPSKVRAKSNFFSTKKNEDEVIVIDDDDDDVIVLETAKRSIDDNCDGPEKKKVKISHKNAQVDQV
tara:strand:- start:1493 stop:2245 length:753 start_codon:yes stop_codon:yes gene_type:complete